MTLMEIRRFDRSKDNALWNEFIGKSKNQTFLFHRDFMDYHMDRFEDYSLMIYDHSGELTGVLPANISTESSNTVVSHQGLTYGGLVVDKEVKLKNVLAHFYHLLSFLSANGIEQLRLKQFPAFFNENPTDEIEYVLFLLDAVLYRRDVAMVIDQKNRIPYTGNIRREGSKAEKAGAEIKESIDMNAFWTNVLEPNLKLRFGVNPVHSLEEINRLKAKFPEQIRQFDVLFQDEIVAGSTFFIANNVVHCQYIAANELGRKTGALNYLFKHLIDHTFQAYRYFDFGIVNENDGKAINEGMLFWKESFGGRSQRHDFYTIQTSSFKNLEPYISK
jgi:hypothetical protein